MAEKLLDIEVVSPQKSVYSGKAVSVTLPGTLSSFQVLYNHAPLISSLEPGIIKISSQDKREIFLAVTSGFTEVCNNKVSVLVENAIESAEINVINEQESRIVAMSFCEPRS